MSIGKGKGQSQAHDQKDQGRPVSRFKCEEGLRLQGSFLICLMLVLTILVVCTGVSQLLSSLNATLTLYGEFADNGYKLAGNSLPGD
jgi:hypothetical protein